MNKRDEVTRLQRAAKFFAEAQRNVQCGVTELSQLAPDHQGMWQRASDQVSRLGVLRGVTREAILAVSSRGEEAPTNG